MFFVSRKTWFSMKTMVLSKTMVFSIKTMVFSVFSEKPPWRLFNAENKREIPARAGISLKISEITVKSRLKPGFLMPN